ncbi:sigma-70 family RNA polymerase sigma factor [Wenzhouxiangella sp. XN79A]|uniref:ECF-type sigma factor n=1 Tax=Wenzhouxiangella sp. XN79A TaxID=2724193 RepID=UPI00144ADDEC|nr:ECF-type sigma factor [Wenzhouxiangella sp. XN79A]NKI34901.1 sigma-70 family RNA polymerase sigma factor [Wenzhouxiangella sp. XN79A]
MTEAPITQLLDRAARGDRAADEALVAAVVGQLERIARNQLAAGNRGGLDGLTLEPQMVAHDAILKLFEQPVEFENRRHFFAYATQVMARAIIDYQRKRGAQKRGGDLQRVTLSWVRDESSLDLFDVPEALTELQALDPRKAELVGLRVFWGATMEEAADLLEISLSTAERDWRFARRWLADWLDRGVPRNPG